jgi:DUF438 domain-containing protein
MTYFKEGKKDKAIFWIQIKDRFFLISYFAVKDDDGEFIGTLEATQDITEIRSLEGEWSERVPILSARRIIEFLYF